MDVHMVELTFRGTGTQKERERDKHTDRLVDRLADRLTDRETDGSIDRRINRHTDSIDSLMGRQTDIPMYVIPMYGRMDR